MKIPAIFVTRRPERGLRYWLRLLREYMRWAHEQVLWAQAPHLIGEGR